MGGPKVHTACLTIPFLPKGLSVAANRCVGKSSSCCLSGGVRSAGTKSTFREGELFVGDNPVASWLGPLHAPSKRYRYSQGGFPALY